MNASLFDGYLFFSWNNVRRSEIYAYRALRIENAKYRSHLLDARDYPSATGTMGLSSIYPRIRPALKEV